ncbi:MAG: toll/interleukin-1 receptor domain-containing protein, partial [Gluconacetobacter sp.]
MRNLIFISYSSKDAEFVTKMVRDIEKNGVRCWMSARDIEPGADYQGAIVDAMERAAAVLLVFSSNANASKEIVKELALASQKGRTVIPARVEDILPKGAFEYQITNAQFIDLFRDYNDAIIRLSRSLQAQIEIATDGKTTIAPLPYQPSKKPNRALLAG